MHLDDSEEKLLRSVALQNAQAILLARERAERALIEAKEALERKTSELAEQREFFRVTLASIGDAVITTDTDSRITFLNPVGEAMTGWKLSEAVGRPLDEVFRIINERTGQPGTNPVTKVLRDGAVVGLANHTALISRDGRQIAIDDSAAPIRDAAGEIAGVVMVFHDVTEQRRAEETVRASNERVTNILESITDGFVVLDHEWRIVYLNQKGEEILRPLNKSRANLIGRNHWEEFPDTIGTNVDKNYRRAMAEQVKVEFETFYPPLNAWFEIRCYPGRDGLSIYFHDITNQKKTAETFRENAQRLRAMFNQAAVGIATASLDGRFTEANQKFLDILGYSLEEVRQRTFGDITHPDDLDRTNASVQRLLAGEIADLVYEKRYVRKDGSFVWSLTTVTLLKDATGKPQHYIGVVEDITQRKEAELERERLISVLERSLNEIYIFDTETLRFQYVNEGARRNLGFSLEEMRNKTPLDIKPEFTEASFREMVAPLLSGAKAKHVFYTVHRRANGTDYPIEVHLQAVSQGGRKVFLAVILDITERRKAVEQLRRSEEELRALADSIPQLAWMANSDGHIFWYNRRWYDYTGTTFEQMAGWGWQLVHDPEMLPVVVERWNESLRTGNPFDMEFPLRGADGVFRWFLTRVNPVRDSEGRVTRWFGTNTNVDEVRRTREALREETRVLELLNNTGTVIAAKLDLQSIVQSVTDAATQLTAAKFGAFFYNVVNDQGETLVLYTLSGAPREAFEKFGVPRNTPVFNPTFRGEGVVRSPDITKDPRYGKMPPHHGMPKGHLPVRSYLAVPVVSRTGEVIGGLFFGHPDPDVFTERSERLAVGVAAQAAIAIDNARLYAAAQKEIAERTRAEQALAQRMRLTAARAEISTALAGNEDLPTGLRRCTEALVRHLDAAFARIWTLNGEVLELRASSGMYTHLDGPHSRIRVGEFKIGRIAQNREPHLTNDVKNDPNISSPDWARREGIVAFAGYPLTVEDHLIGVVALFACQPLTSEVLKELSLIADGVAQWIQRKQAEDALREAQERLSRHAEDLEIQVNERTASLRDTIGELEAFSYSISHDMRAPLRAMQSFAHILAEEYGSKLGEEGNEYIRRITTAAHRMDRLIQDVLNYSRIARAELPLEPVNVEALVRDIVQTYPNLHPPAADIQIEGGLPVVLGNQAVLTQCISNLLGNAVKFVSPGATPRVRISSKDTANPQMVRLCFEDNGVGIEKEQHENIFGIFQRVGRSYDGTGIGLAIVKKGVERMDGRVGVESELGKGSTFWLELKRA